MLQNLIVNQLPDEIRKGLNHLKTIINYQIENPIYLTVKKIDRGLRISLNNQQAEICYSKPNQFFRAFSILIENIKKGLCEFTIEEKPYMETIGIMIDASRNGSLKVEKVKELIMRLALMGYNMFMLYTEETYEVEDEPYFGYMRGKYTYNELRVIDEFAKIFGIEVVPCIQTLGHLEQFLKWGDTYKYRDTGFNLIVGEETTYELLEKMIVAASRPFSTNRIHIGMDEVYILGLGRYMQKHGYVERNKIFVEHIKKVLEITNKYNLKPMMWSDMFFHNAGDQDFENLKKELPKDVQMVYWDYYNRDPEHYRKMIKRHKELGFEPIFAGGDWTWVGPVPHYKITIPNTKAALEACKKENIKEVFVTLWGDDGTECNYLAAMLGMVYFAEHCYKDEVESNYLDERCKTCTGVGMEAFLDIGRLNELKVNEEDINSNPAKYLLWQDILLGLFDKYVEGIDTKAFYSSLKQRLENYLKEGLPKDIFLVPKLISEVLEVKGDIGVRLKKAYENNDRQTLKEILEKELSYLENKVEELRIAHYEQWMGVYKPFGWEVIDIRYGGLISRIKTAKRRISDYLSGEIEKIEELEVERLYFAGRDNKKIYCESLYSRIVTANVFGHTNIFL
ncbi:beta-N-acetylhexosaminidase [Caldicellulosiruptoraceae bacterium PP1]